MKLRRVNPNKIMVPEVRVTAQFDPELYEMFKLSISEVGQITPIICMELDPTATTPEGEPPSDRSEFRTESGKTLVLVDGLHRLVEAKEHNEPFIDVVILPGDEVDVFTRNIFLDHLRGKTPVSQMRRVIDHLVQEYHLDSETIAQKTGLSRDYIEGIMEINELTPYALEALDDGRLKVGSARALAKLKDPVRIDVIAADAITFNRSVAYVADTVKMALPTATPEVASLTPLVPRETAKVKCGVCTVDYLPQDLRMIALCPACFSATFQLIAELRRHDEEDKVPQQVPDVVP